jgi:hypothetical protein
MIICPQQLVTLSQEFMFTHFSKKNTVAEPSIPTSNPTPTKVEKYIPPKTTYVCDGRQHCSQMGSYEEAKYFIENCPDTKMDGDRDGIPCERQFNKW